MPDDIRADLRDFIVNEIGSIAQLELLLLLHKDSSREWTVEAAARELYTGAEAMATLLEGFRNRGYVVTSESSPVAYRFAPTDAAVAPLVTDLARLYQERRVTVINLIYAGPMHKLQSFADAFRLRKPKTEN
jgi:hypothetical protein